MPASCFVSTRRGCTRVILAALVGAVRKNGALHCLRKTPVAQGSSQRDEASRRSAYRVRSGYCVCFPWEAETSVAGAKIVLSRRLHVLLLQ